MFPGGMGGMGPGGMGGMGSGGMGGMMPGGGGSGGGGFPGGSGSSGGGHSGFQTTGQNTGSTTQIKYIVQKPKECLATKICMETCGSSYHIGEVGSSGCQSCTCPPKQTIVHSKHILHYFFQ